ncbi:MAG: TIGR03086 family metal-binding protein [Actinomycetota bacterium]|nr:TIGR03086 family metal-binding protein [Actinomycetota bacterium]
MTPNGTAAPLVAGVALLERAFGYTLSSLVLVTPAALTRPSPCRGWDLAILLAHMNDSLLALHEAIGTGRVPLEPTDCGADGALPVPAVAALRARGCRMLGEWSEALQEQSGSDGSDGLGAGSGDVVSVAGRLVTRALVAATGAVEVVVHGWDVACACGRPRSIPAPLAEELLELAPLLVSAADRGGRFGPPVEVSPRATAGDRLVAFLGREPR